MKSQYFFPIWIVIVLFFEIWETSRNIQVTTAFCYQKLFWLFTGWINCSSDDLKNFENSRPSASHFKSFSRSLKQLFLVLGQNNFGSKIPITFIFFPVILQKRVLKIYSFKQWVMMDSKNTNPEDFCIWMLGEIFQVSEKGQ